MPNPQMKWHSKTAYIFDLDGTLIDSSQAILKALSLALQEVGIVFSSKRLVSSIIGPPIQELLERLELQEISTEQSKEVIRAFRHHYDTAVDDTSPLYEGVRPFLSQLKKRGYRLAIATNKPLIPTQRLLKQHELETVFDSVICVDSKPPRRLSKADMLLELCEYLSLEKETTVMVGDSLSDIQAAQQTGLCSIGVFWGYEVDKASLRETADWVCNSPSDLSAMIL